MPFYDKFRLSMEVEIDAPHGMRHVPSALQEIANEFVRARQKHGPMRGAHEGYAVLLEEVDELWDEIKGNNPANARKEVIQVAAMALAYLIEVSPAAKHEGMLPGGDARALAEGMPRDIIDPAAQAQAEKDFGVV
jgi:hypothetical protein